MNRMRCQGDYDIINTDSFLQSFDVKSQCVLRFERRIR